MALSMTQMDELQKLLFSKAAPYQSHSAMNARHRMVLEKIINLIAPQLNKKMTSGQRDMLEAATAMLIDNDVLPGVYSGSQSYNNILEALMGTVNSTTGYTSYSDAAQVDRLAGLAFTTNAQVNDLIYNTDGTMNYGVTNGLDAKLLSQMSSNYIGKLTKGKTLDQVSHHLSLGHDARSMREQMAAQIAAGHFTQGGEIHTRLLRENQQMQALEDYAYREFAAAYDMQLGGTKNFAEFRAKSDEEQMAILREFQDSFEKNYVEEDENTKKKYVLKYKKGTKNNQRIRTKVVNEETGEEEEVDMEYDGGTSIRRIALTDPRVANAIKYGTEVMGTKVSQEAYNRYQQQLDTGETSHDVLKEEYVDKTESYIKRASENVRLLSKIYNTNDLNTIIANAQMQGIGDIVSEGSIDAVRSRIEELQLMALKQNRNIKELFEERENLVKALAPDAGGEIFVNSGFVSAVQRKLNNLNTSLDKKGSFPIKSETEITAEMQRSYNNAEVHFGGIALGKYALNKFDFLSDKQREEIQNLVTSSLEDLESGDRQGASYKSQYIHALLDKAAGRKISQHHIRAAQAQYGDEVWDASVKSGIVVQIEDNLTRQYDTDAEATATNKTRDAIKNNQQAKTWSRTMAKDLSEVTRVAMSMTDDEIDEQIAEINKKIAKGAGEAQSQALQTDLRKLHVYKNIRKTESEFVRLESEHASSNISVTNKEKERAQLQRKWEDLTSSMSLEERQEASKFSIKDLDTKISEAETDQEKAKYSKYKEFRQFLDDKQEFYNKYGQYTEYDREDAVNKRLSSTMREKKQEEISSLRTLDEFKTLFEGEEKTHITEVRKKLAQRFEKNSKLLSEEEVSELSEEDQKRFAAYKEFKSKAELIERQVGEDKSFTDTSRGEVRDKLIKRVYKSIAQQSGTDERDMESIIAQADKFQDIVEKEGEQAAFAWLHSGLEKELVGFNDVNIQQRQQIIRDIYMADMDTEDLRANMSFQISNTGTHAESKREEADKWKAEYQALQMPVDKSYDLNYGGGLASMLGLNLLLPGIFGDGAVEFDNKEAFNYNYFQWLGQQDEATRNKAKSGNDAEKSEVLDQFLQSEEGKRYKATTLARVTESGDFVDTSGNHGEAVNRAMAEKLLSNTDFANAIGVKTKRQKEEFAEAIAKGGAKELMLKYLPNSGYKMHAAIGGGFYIAEDKAMYDASTEINRNLKAYTKANFERAVSQEFGEDGKTVTSKEFVDVLSSMYDFQLQDVNKMLAANNKLVNNKYNFDTIDSKGKTTKTHFLSGSDMDAAYKWFTNQKEGVNKTHIKNVIDREYGTGVYERLTSSNSAERDSLRHDGIIDAQGKFAKGSLQGKDIAGVSSLIEQEYTRALVDSHYGKGATKMMQEAMQSQEGLQKAMAAGLLDDKGKITKGEFKGKDLKDISEWFKLGKTVNISHFQRVLQHEGMLDIGGATDSKGRSSLEQILLEKQKLAEAADGTLRFAKGTPFEGMTLEEALKKSNEETYVEGKGKVTFAEAIQEWKDKSDITKDDVAKQTKDIVSGLGDLGTKLDTIANILRGNNTEGKSAVKTGDGVQVRSAQAAGSTGEQTGETN